MAKTWIKAPALVAVLAVLASCAAERPAEPGHCALAGAALGMIGGSAGGGIDSGDGRDVARGAALGAVGGAMVGYAVCSLMAEPTSAAAPQPEARAAASPEPEDLAEPATVFRRKIVLHGANFAFDEAALSADAEALLSGDVAELREDASLRVRIEGHTDSIGTAEYNRRLSEQRALTVKAYLVSQGVAAERITAIGFGEDYPAASNDTEESRAVNRRAEIKIIDKTIE